MTMQRELLSNSACLGVHAATLFRLALIQQLIAAIQGTYIGSRLSFGQFDRAARMRTATSSSPRFLNAPFGYIFHPLRAWHTHGEQAFSSCMRLCGTFFVRPVRALELIGRAFPPTVTAGANAPTNATAAKIRPITDGTEFKSYSSLKDKAAKPLHNNYRQSEQGYAGVLKGKRIA